MVSRGAEWNKKEDIMNSYKSVYLGDIYDIERQELAKAACNDSPNVYMQGICAMVAAIEGFILDKEAEAKNDDF